MLTRPRTTITSAILVTMVVLACGAAGKEQAGEAGAASGVKPPAAKHDAKADSTGGGKAISKGAANSDAKPACMHCGATCCLTAICVCEPGTKKRPRTEYEATCEPICVPGCGSKPWPFGRGHRPPCCSSCCVDPCRCPGWVRDRKTLTKETVEEEVPTIKRKVAYVCATCAGCRGERAEKASWWWAWLSWWPARKPGL